MEDIDKKIEQKLYTDRKRELEAAQHGIKKQIWELIEMHTPLIFIMLVECFIFAIVIGLIFWFQVTDGNPTALDKERWSDYKEFVSYINSHILVALFTFISVKSRQ